MGNFKMTTTSKINLLAAALLVVSFFLPWMIWKEASLSGNAMPDGQFFAAAKEQFSVDNPFPQFSFAFKIFWLIPAAAVAVITLILLNKNVLWPAVAAGLLSLSLVLVYFLFSKSLVDQLGISKSVWNLVKPWLIVQAIAAVAIVLTAADGKWILKTGLVLVTAVATIVGFTIVSKKVEKKIFDEKFDSTENVKADYTLTASRLLQEFLTNDTASNKKYLEKVLEINGNATAVELAADSTGTIRFEDSTGSYAIFSVEKSQYDKMNALKAGEAVSVKGVCSGSIFSDILGTTSITFKRSVINKQ
jgi:hypothetical protein